MTPSAIAFTRDYLKAFDQAIASSKNAGQVVAQLRARYPGAALEVIAKLGAEAQLAN
jgi:hypothetical protein